MDRRGARSPRREPCTQGRRRACRTADGESWPAGPPRPAAWVGATEAVGCPWRHSRRAFGSRALPFAPRGAVGLPSGPWPLETAEHARVRPGRAAGPAAAAPAPARPWERPPAAPTGLPGLSPCPAGWGGPPMSGLGPGLASPKPGGRARPGEVATSPGGQSTARSTLAPPATVHRAIPARRRRRASRGIGRGGRPARRPRRVRRQGPGCGPAPRRPSLAAGAPRSCRRRPPGAPAASAVSSGPRGSQPRRGPAESGLPPQAGGCGATGLSGP